MFNGVFCSKFINVSRPEFFQNWSYRAIISLFIVSLLGVLSSMMTIAIIFLKDTLNKQCDVIIFDAISL